MDDQKLENLKIQLQQLHNEAHEFLQSIPPTQLYGAIGVVIFTIFFFLITVWSCGIVFVHVILHKSCDNGYVHSVHLFEILVAAVRLFKHRASNTIVLTGLSGSGKTVLFYQLRDGSSHQGTVTSMEPNEDTFVLHSETTKKGKVKPVHVVDVPGHSRLKPKLDEFLPLAAGIVFVVDAVEFLPNVRAASEYLYDILTKASVVKRKIPLLLLCNKLFIAFLWAQALIISIARTPPSASPTAPPPPPSVRYVPIHSNTTTLPEPPPALYTDDCPSGLVFSYDLPPSFNCDLVVPNCTDLDFWNWECDVISNHGYGRAASELRRTLPADLHKSCDKLRASRTALSSADIANEYSLGVPGEAFAFHQSLNKISVAETSGSTGDISQLEQFIREYVQA
ncbi:hypothetical protein SASPL_140258 [Salvia splendens]|uniref:Signal recognition particle receptor subunit beta n=1 Tax=Salvia splendens TaxID=180675 RepID=A0A8X8ZBS6_SALSN|nr:hypothetical protein SASPL_140258 [Salvia splendens]